MVYFSSLIYSCALWFSTLRFISFACSRALFVRSEHITVDFFVFSHVNIFIVSGFVVILCIFLFMTPDTLLCGRPVSSLLGDAQPRFKVTVPVFTPTSPGQALGFSRFLAALVIMRLTFFCPSFGCDVISHFICIFWFFMILTIFYVCWSYIFPTVTGAYWKILLIFLLDYLFIADF